MGSLTHLAVSYISRTLGMGSGNEFESFHPLFLVWRKFLAGVAGPFLSRGHGRGGETHQIDLRQASCIMRH